MPSIGPDSTVAPAVAPPASTTQPAGSTGPKGSKGDAESKSFCAILLSYWWVGAAVLGGVISFRIFFVHDRNSEPSDRGVKPGWPCPSGNFEECTDNAVCMDEEQGLKETIKGLPPRLVGEFYCKGLPGQKCVYNECADMQQLRCLSGTCQVKAVDKLMAGTEPCPPLTDFEVVGGICKAKDGARCDQGTAIPMHWCKEGSKCVRHGEYWMCKSTLNVSNIQLGETTDTWHPANRSREMESNILRKKRKQTSGFLQVDLD